MIRFLNLVAFAALIGSAVYAYSIKYETLYRSDQIAKLTRQIDEEHDALGKLRAEWEHLVRLDRLQPLADKYLDLQETRPNQIVSFSALPEHSVKGDPIGQKLEALGLAAPTNTPGSKAGPGQTATPPSGAR